MQGRNCATFIIVKVFKIFRITLRNAKIVSRINILKYSFTIWLFWSKFAQKGVLGMEIKESVIEFRINLHKYPCTEFHLKQITLKFWDQICPKKKFWDRKLRKKLLNSESAPLNSLSHRVSFKTKHLQVSGPNLTKKGLLGTKFRKIRYHTFFLG